MLSITKITLGHEDAEYFSISSVERFSDDSGWYGLLTMQSAPFALLGHKFYFDDLLEFRDGICRIYKNLEGSAILRPRYERDCLEVTATSRGHIAVKGHFETYTPETNRIDMEFILDQTFLPDLISSLNRVIEETQANKPAHTTAGNAPV